MAGKCEGGTKTFANSTRDLIEGKQFKSFDLTHQNNFDFKRFDLIPGTKREIMKRILSQEHVDNGDLTYLYEQLETGPQGYSSRPACGHYLT